MNPKEAKITAINMILTAINLEMSEIGIIDSLVDTDEEKAMVQIEVDQIVWELKEKRKEAKS